MSLSGKVFIVTGVLDALGQGVTAGMLACGAKLALVDKRAGPPLEHRAGALAFTVAAEINEVRDPTREFQWTEGSGDNSSSPDVLVQCAHQSNISDAGPIALT